MNDKLIFVYKADSGFFNFISDAAHKILSPKTYPCSLCGLTYGNLGMKRKWAAFIKSLPYQVEFMYRDQIEKLYPNRNFELPVILKANKQKAEVLIGHEELSSFKELDELIEGVESSL